MKYYEKLFNRVGTFTQEKVDSLQHLINIVISEDYRNMLQAPMSKDEIKQSMFAMKNGNAPGPDGFTAEFFKTNREIVGKDVIAALKFCFENEYMYFRLNSTSLSLIPKIKDAVQMMDFRPIPCYNLLHRCHSDVLANIRLKKFCLT